MNRCWKVVEEGLTHSPGVGARMGWGTLAGRNAEIEHRGHLAAWARLALAGGCVTRAAHSASLSLAFHVCEMGIIIKPHILPFVRINRAAHRNCLERYLPSQGSVNGGCYHYCHYFVEKMSVPTNLANGMCSKGEKQNASGFTKIIQIFLRMSLKHGFKHGLFCVNKNSFPMFLMHGSH